MQQRPHDSGTKPEPADGPPVEGKIRPREVAAGLAGLSAVQQHATVMTLEDEVKQRLATELLNTLGDQRRSQAVEGVDDTAKRQLAATAVDHLSPAQRQDVAEGIVATLPPRQQQQVVEYVTGPLSTPNAGTTNRLWIIVVSTLTLALFVFGTMAFVLVLRREPAEAPLALATTALGGIVGLVATTPGARRHG